MAIKLSNELALRLLKHLGVDATRVREVTLFLQAGKAPELTVVRLLDEVEGDKFIEDLGRYEFVIKEVGNG